MEWAEISFRVPENEGIFFWPNDGKNKPKRYVRFSEFKNL